MFKERRKNMKEKINVNPNEAQTQDAQLVAEEIIAGNEKAAQVDVEADYEASKAFSVSEIDRTDEGAKAAQEAVATDFEVPQTEETEVKAVDTSDPGQYKDMANDVNPQMRKESSSQKSSGESGDPANYIDMAKEIKS